MNVSFRSLRLRTSATSTSLWRAFAAGPGETVPGINIYKTGSDPVAQPDSEYPAWVAELSRARTTLTELRRTWAAQQTFDEEDDVNIELLAKLVHHENRAKIRGRNNAAGSFS